MSFMIDSDSPEDEQSKEPAKPSRHPWASKKDKTRDLATTMTMLSHVAGLVHKSRDGKLSVEYSGILSKVSDIHDAMEEAAERGKVRGEKRKAEADKKALKRIRNDAVDECIKRYQEFCSTLREDSRAIAPRGALDRIIDDVKRERQLPPEIVITKGMVKGRIYHTITKKASAALV